MATKSTPAASVPPDNNAASAAEVHASAPVVEAHASAPAAKQQNWPAIALGALAAILFVALFAVWFGPVNAGSPSTSSANVTLGAPASSVAIPVPTVVVVDATRNDDKLILSEMCTLHSDGTSRLISAQTDLKRAQDALAKNKGSKEVKTLIAALEEAAKSLPPHTVIAEVPLSVLPEGASCADWRRQRAYQLVVGAPKPRANKS